MNRNHREGRMVLILAIAAVLVTMAVQIVSARPNNMRGAEDFLYARGSAGVGVLGQIQFTLTSATGETGWAWSFCNDGTDEVIFQAGATRGTELTTPALGAEGTTVTMGSVGRLNVGRCVEVGDLKEATAVFQGETTTQSVSVWGTK